MFFFNKVCLYCCIAIYFNKNTYLSPISTLKINGYGISIALQVKLSLSDQPSCKYGIKQLEHQSLQSEQAGHVGRHGEKKHKPCLRKRNVAKGNQIPCQIQQRHTSIEGQRLHWFKLSLDESGYIVWKEW